MLGWCDRLTRPTGAMCAIGATDSSDRRGRPWRPLHGFLLIPATDTSDRRPQTTTERVFPRGWGIVPQTDFKATWATDGGDVGISPATRPTDGGDRLTRPTGATHGGRLAGAFPAVLARAIHANGRWGAGGSGGCGENARTQQQTKQAAT